jgi:hypothetical protein
MEQAPNGTQATLLTVKMKLFKKAMSSNALVVSVAFLKQPALPSEAVQTKKIFKNSKK